jgi:hypothetical protein
VSDAPPNKRVPILIGNRFATVDEADLPKMPKGTRVLTKKEADDLEADATKEAAEARDQERYDKLPTGVKVGGAIGTALSTVNPLMIGSTPGAPRPAAAYASGVTEGLTAGTGQGLVRQGIDATLGHDVGDKYAQQIEDQHAANPLAHGAGNLMGTTAGVVSSAGAAAENLATKGLARAGVQATSALGRAGVAAAELGARGAVEGGIIGGGEYAGEQLLQDHDVAADKIFAGMGTGALYGGATGAVLAGGLSLAGSGLRAGLSRAVSREGADIGVRQVSEEAAGSFPKLATDATVDDAVAARQAIDAAPPRSAGASSTVTEAGKRLANDLWADSLGATKVQMRKALENLGPNPAANKLEVGEYVGQIMRAHLGEDASAWAVGKSGRADDILKVIEADKAGRIVAGLDNSLKAAPARVDMAAVFGRAGQEVENMMRDPIRAAGAEAFWNRVSREMEALKLSGKVAPDGTIDAVEAFHLRSGLAKNAYEVSKVSGHAGDAYKAFLRDLDTTTIAAIDESASKAGQSSVGDQIRYWKRQYQLATKAEAMATGGAERYAGNNFFGLREGIGLSTGLAAGHAVVPLVSALGFKVAKERGKAVAAYMLSQSAERGTLARLVSKTDDQIARASKGLIALPEKGAAKASEVMPPPRAVVTKALARVAAFQANPDDFVDHATQQTEAMATHSPEIATGLVQRQVKAMAFLSDKVPQQGDPDPLDPHPKLHMTPSEEASFGRYAWYCEKPDRFFAEVARGKLTPEGAEVAQALMPRAFEELQAQTFEALTTQLARGKRLPFRQRELLGQLLDFAATPAQRPDHRVFLQQNVSDVLPSNERIATAGPKGPRRPMTSQNGSALDRLEGKGPGRR